MTNQNTSTTSMKIGVLPQTLYTNIGGILQCYALQTVFERMEHEVNRSE